MITLQDIFVYDHSYGFDENGRSLGRLRSTGLRPKFWRSSRRRTSSTRCSSRWTGCDMALLRGRAVRA